jgi:WD40 repeat protein
VAFLLNSKQVVLGLSNKTVRLWDAVTGAPLQTLKGYLNSVYSVAFFFDGKLVPTFCVSNHWLIEGKANILWLSPDYQSTYEAI